MKVYKFNNVFAHIEYTLYEHFLEDPAYDNALFVLGYNVLPSLDFLREKYPGYRIIIYQFEQLFHGSPWVNKGCWETLKSADEIWDYDQGNIDWMRQYYKLDAKLVPLMYTESLDNMAPVEKDKCDIDVLFYGYLHERRARFLVNLQHAMAGKFKVFDLYGVWGEDLDSYVSRSKIILNIRSKENGRQEQPRIYYLAINGRCVLSEISPINYIGDAIVEVPYEDLLDKTMNMLQTGEWYNVARQAKQKYKNQSKKYEMLL